MNGIPSVAKKYSKKIYEEHITYCFICFFMISVGMPRGLTLTSRSPSLRLHRHNILCRDFSFEETTTGGFRARLQGGISLAFTAFDVVGRGRIVGGAVEPGVEGGIRPT